MIFVDPSLYTTEVEDPSVQVDIFLLNSDFLPSSARYLDEERKAYRDQILTALTAYVLLASMAHIIGARRLFWTSFLDLKSQSP